MIFNIGDIVKVKGNEKEVIVKTLDRKKIYLGRLSQVWNTEREITEWKYVDIELR